MGLLSPLRDQVISCTRPSQNSWPEPVPVVRTDWRPLSSPLMADTSVRRIRTFFTWTCSPVLPSIYALPYSDTR